MGRKSGPDKKKIAKIRATLKRNPQGIWIREIARQSGLDKSLVSRYLTEFMQDEIEDVITVTGGLVKFVRLQK